MLKLKDKTTFPAVEISLTTGEDNYKKKCFWKHEHECDKNDIEIHFDGIRVLKFIPEDGTFALCAVTDGEKTHLSKKGIKLDDDYRIIQINS